ncbi:MAG: isoprenylcysteine carboxylmethyltransferase family protein [bacterium]|nr:isoprenylcysteine carboxylmethyltransferase family protein [bacterium]
MSITSGWGAYLALVLAGLLGAGSLLLLVVFLFAGSLHLTELELGGRTELAWDALLCLAFFVQHSGMIRSSFRRRLLKILPPHYQGALYSVASGVLLLVLVVFWQESPQAVVSFQGALRWLLRAVFFLSFAGFAWGLRALGTFDAFGLLPIRAHLRGTQPKEVPFTVRGPYLLVRHPLYFFALLMLWACPDLTADRLLFNLLWTAWVVVGTVLEERDLVAEFGKEYCDYQRRVPMLIPWRIRGIR